MEWGVLRAPGPTAGIDANTIRATGSLLPAADAIPQPQSAFQASIPRHSSASGKMADAVPDQAIEESILELLSKRRPGATVCPSEAARALSEDWRPLMQRVRDVAASMGAEDRLRVMQRGAVVDPATARGPVRLALPPAERGGPHGTREGE